MRTIQTYVLRLLVDREEPHVLRGVIRAVADGEEQAFAGGQGLLALLQRMGDPTLHSLGEGDARSMQSEEEIEP